jgi:lysophospholipase L1-like esterase
MTPTHRARLPLALAAALVLAWAGGPGRASPPDVRWVGSWASAQQIPEPQNALAPQDLADATLRQVVRLTLGGERLRIRVSNAFGTEPLKLGPVHVARPLAPGSAAIDPASDRAVTFDGRPEVVIPAGAEYLSDPVDLPTRSLTSLTISIHFDAAPAGQTGHPGSRATSYLVHGDRTGATDLPDARRIDHWWAVSGVEVEAWSGSKAVVALGDSITDGHGATTNGDDRWPDGLATRLTLSSRVRGVAVLNEGIGGNRLLLDGLGPNALSRFDRDVLGQAGVRWVIVLEGINDVGHLARLAPASPAEHQRHLAQMIGAYGQLIARAHAHGIEAIGATLTPFMGSDYYHPDAATEADRQALNAWIRAPGHFDAVVDFDAKVRDPAHPDRPMTAATTCIRRPRATR